MRNSIVVKRAEMLIILPPPAPAMQRPPRGAPAPTPAPANSGDSRGTHLGPSGPGGSAPATWACAVHVRGVTGFACYEAEDNALWVAEGHDDPADWAFLRLALSHAAPRCVYTSSKSSDELVAALSAGLEAAALEAADAAADDGGGASAPRAACEVRIEKSTLFTLEAARRRLCTTTVDSIPAAAQRDATGAPNVHAVHALLRIDAEAQVRAAGALIAILQRDGLLLAGALGGDASPARLASIRERSLSGFLALDDATVASIAIFAQEAHPSQLGLGTAKEGLSAFGVLDTCVTQPGKRMLRTWFRRPLVDPVVISARHDAVEFFSTADEASGTLSAVLRRLRDVPRLVERLRSVGAVTPKKDWQTLLESIVALLQLAEALQACAEHEGAAAGAQALFQRTAAAIDETRIKYVYELIAGVIDFEDAADAVGEQSQAMVQHGVSDELDDMKRLYQGLPDFLTRVAQREMQRVPNELCSRPPTSEHDPGCSGVVLSLSYIPKVGHVVRMQGPGTRPLCEELQRALPDYAFAFEGETDDGYGAYYFCDVTRELDEKFGDLFHRILDLEGALLCDLKKRVLEHAPALAAAATSAAEIDCLVALARGARQLNLRRPTLVSENVLRIKNGRHLLQEQTVEVFVPNDTDVGATQGRVNVVTGPNFSGKSVYLKQVALIVFLAHVGSFVPADAATVGITDRIFTRIASSDSIAAAVAQSSFMSDTHQVAVMLRHATPRSLLIIDEYGKGTLTADGIGLLCACLSNLAERAEPPKAFVSTHFSEVLDEEFVPRVPALKFYTMNVLATVHAKPGAAAAGSTASAGSASAAGEEDIVFLYRLVPGHVASSYGIHCARLAGVPAPVLDRAVDVMACVAEGKPLAATRKDPRLALRNAHCLAMVQALLDFDEEAGDMEAFLARVRQLAEQADDALVDAAAAARAAADEGGSAAEGDDAGAQPHAQTSGNDAQS